MYGSAQDLINAGYKKYIGWNNTEALADYKATGGGERDSSGGGSAPSIDSVISNAQKLNQFNISANQPAITQLQSQQAPLEQRYKDLVANIKGQQQVSDNSATLNTSTELGRRGILPTSGLYQKDLSNALLPVDTGYQGVLNQADTAHSQDVNTLANQIASLQSGNPEGATSGAFQLAGVQQNANQFSQSLAQALNLASNKSLPSNILALAQAQYLGGQTQTGVSNLAKQFNL